MIKEERLSVAERDTSKNDNRIFSRNPMYDVKALIKNINTGERFNAFMKDISGSGIGLSTPEEFRRGTVFEVSLEIPDGFGPLKLLGRVAWSKEAQYLGCRTGLEILNPRFMTVSRILKLFF